MARPGAQPLTGYTGFLLRRAFVRASDVGRACITDGAHVRDVVIMSILAERGAVSQRELADITHVSQSVIVKLVDGLEQRGWVIRERAAHDRRSYALQLTPAGSEALGDLTADLDQGETELTGALSIEERTSLTTLLTTLLADDAALEIASLAERTGYLIAHAHRLSRGWAVKGLEPTGLHPRDFGVLSIVAADQPCSQNHLAAKLGISPPAVLSFVDELAGQGLLDRERNTDDRRVLDLTLTDKGARLLIEGQRVATDVQAKVQARLGYAGDAELRRLLVQVIGDG